MELRKETSPHGKWYGDACGTAFGLELIGERWSMLVIRELLLGGRRFSDLRASLPGISAKILTERLTKLEAEGVVAKRKLPPPASAQIYELTEWGYLAEPAILELGRWAARSPEHNPQLPLSPVSLMLSMRTMLVPARAGGLSAQVGFTVGGEHFLATLADGALSVRRAAAGEGDVRVSVAKPLPLLRLLYGHQPLEQVEASSDLVVEGDRELLRRYAGLFSLPPKITLPGHAPSS